MADLYQEAGVNIDAGNEAVQRIKNLVRGTYNPQVLGDLGNFGGLFSFPAGISGIRFWFPVPMGSGPN